MSKCRTQWVLALTSLVLVTAGCAGTNVSRIADPIYATGGKYTDDKANGIRYYEAAPFLLVYSDGKGGLISKLLFLPDLTRKRVIDPYSMLSSNNTTLTFANGVLTQGKSVVDETIVPKAIVGALEKAATAIASGAFNTPGGAPSTQLPPPQLFKIVLTSGGARLVGGQTIGSDGKVRMIDVTVSAPDEAKEKTAPPGQEKPSSATGGSGAQPAQQSQAGAQK